MSFLIVQDNHKEDLKLLQQQSNKGTYLGNLRLVFSKYFYLNNNNLIFFKITALLDFSKLAWDFVANGPNSKLYQAAARKYQCCTNLGLQSC